jgi:poly(A) polymerase
MIRDPLEADDLSARILAALRRRSGLRAFLVHLGSVAESAGGSLWVVGGFVRDIAEGSAGRDIDLLATGVGFDRLGKILRRLPAVPLGIRRIVRAGKQFPVYRIFPVWGGGVIDATSPRNPNAGKRGSGMPALSREEADAWGDASRRDFTVNGILFRILPRKGRLYGTLFDPFGGVRDLRRNLIRGIGDPAERFREDPVRILRAIRLKNERPGSAIERSTWGALRRGSAFLPGSCPQERIYAELSRSLSADPSRTLTDLHRAGILARLIPEIPEWGAGPLHRTKRRYRFLERLVGRPLPEPLSLAALLVDVAEREAFPPPSRDIRLPNTEAAARRLHMPGPRRIVRLLGDLCRLARLEKSATPRATAEAILARQPEPDHLIALYAAACRAVGRRETDLRAMRRKANRTPVLLSGADLVAVGVPAGPRVEEILLAVREATLSGTVVSRNEALHLAVRLQAGGKPPNLTPGATGTTGREGARSG